MDGLFIYDEGSTDNTFRISSRYADSIVRRPNDVSTFLEHEGEYRKAAFEAMESSMNLKEGDWIFSFDADEFLSGATSALNLRSDLEVLMSMANHVGRDSVNIHIPEVWDVNGPYVMIRTDGFWNQMSLPRLFKYREDWREKGKTFRNKAMGCGSGPQYTYNNMLTNIHTCSLLHFGYAYDEDKYAKSERYLSLPNHGHNPKHIKSILQNPTLKRWEGMVPHWWRGVR
jgi:hypothetical protein